MWHKIKSGTNIQPGINIKKYPLEGDPVEAVDLEYSGNTLMYKVNAIKQVNGEDDEISLNVATTASPDIHEVLGTKEMSTSGDVPLVKMRKEFAEESCWWFFTP